MIIAVCIVGMGALCVLLCWLEHKARLGEAVERAIVLERRRVALYLREQSRIAEAVSKCTMLGHRGRDQEAYASAVLHETASEIDECAHYVVVK